MSFNSVEIPISDVVSRIADPVERSEVEELLLAADARVGGADGKTSEIEARDYLDRDATLLVTHTRPAQRALQILGTVAPAPEVTGKGRTFLAMRTALARVTRELRDLQSRDGFPTAGQQIRIKSLEGELRDTVYAASELAKDPQFASIVGHANAATIRVGALRAWGVFVDDVFATPALLDASPQAALVCARLELAAVRAAADHISATAYSVVSGPPCQVENLVDTLRGIRGNIEQLQRGGASRELDELVGDFNATLRQLGDTTYSQRIRTSFVTREQVRDVELPEPLTSMSAR